MVVPALPLRYLPATARLHELLATRLGPPLRLEITTAPRDAQTSTGLEFAGDLDWTLVGLLDWCRHVVRAAPAAVAVEPAASGEPGERNNVILRIQFRAARRGAERASADVAFEADWLKSERPSAPPVPAIARLSIAAEHGSAIIDGARQIAWTNGGRTVEETLEAERSEYEVMIDLFCRRVAGGLIPVADPGDLTRALDLLRAAADSHHSGSPISLAPERRNGRQSGTAGA